MSPYNYVLNNPIMFIDPDGKIVKPSKAFLKTEYGKSFSNLRQNNRAFQRTIGKFEKGPDFNLTLSIDSKKVLEAGAGALTVYNASLTSKQRTMMDVNTYFMPSTTIVSNKNYKYTEIGTVLVVAHEAVHQKIGLTGKSEDENHDTYNKNRSDLVSILKEYSKDNELGLTDRQITTLSFSGQQDSKDFKAYISGLAKANGSSTSQEREKFNKELSDLIYL